MLLWKRYVNNKMAALRFLHLQQYNHRLNLLYFLNSFTDSISFSFCPLLLIVPDSPQRSKAEIKSKWIYTPKPTINLHGLHRAYFTCLRLRPHNSSVAFSLLRAAHTDVQFCTGGTNFCADLNGENTLPDNNAINKRHSSLINPLAPEFPFKF